MTIKYLCYFCRQKLHANSTFKAVNEVGRKHCDKCGSNEDSLHVYNQQDFDSILAEKKSHELHEEGGNGMGWKKITVHLTDRGVVEFKKVAACRLDGDWLLIREGSFPEETITRIRLDRVTTFMVTCE